MGDANGLDPRDKSQAMEGDLVGAWWGRRGGESEGWGKKVSGVGGW